jgi:uncharacterized phage protein (TIGR01671 family)
MIKREIKFRGLYKGSWVHGSLITRTINGKTDYLIENCDSADFRQYEVDAESVGQYPGLKDKHGKDIYEGDILELVGGTCDFLRCGTYDYQVHLIGTKLVVQYLASGFTLRMPNHLNNNISNLVGNVDQYQFWNNTRSLEIIGNIYENPELLPENAIVSPSKTPEA